MLKHRISDLSLSELLTQVDGVDHEVKKTRLEISRLKITLAENERALTWLEDDLHRAETQLASKLISLAVPHGPDSVQQEVLKLADDLLHSADRWQPQ